MSFDASFFSYFSNAGIIVKCVMLFLTILSVISWTIILQKAFFFRQLESVFERFEYRFWSGIELQKLFQNLDGQKLLGLPNLFLAGFHEYLRLNHQYPMKPEDLLNAISRAMRVACAKEVFKLEENLSLLATIGSTTPYIGLFGTVFGIMTSFKALSQVTSQISIASVAPGISEALVATAMGLFVAIPAVIAYNRYAHTVQVFLDRFEIFQEEFSSILFRQVYSSSKIDTLSEKRI